MSGKLGLANLWFEAARAEFAMTLRDDEVGAGTAARFAVNPPERRLRLPVPLDHDSILIHRDERVVCVIDDLTKLCLAS